MGKIHNFFVCNVIFYGIYLYARNPFEFSDKDLKKYTAIKLQKKEIVESSQHSEWKIIETKNENTHLIQDGQGNVRSISI